MDEKRVAELRLIQAAITAHISEVAFQKALERTNAYSVEDRLRGLHDYEAERTEYMRARVELTLACEQYAKLFAPGPAPASGEARP